MKSLDPRVLRLPAVGEPGVIKPKGPLDQFGSFEVFVQPKDGKPFQHEGIVHAPNIELAYVLAKEAFTRRFLCVSLYVAETRKVYVSPMTEGTTNAYDLIAPHPLPLAEAERGAPHPSPLSEAERGIEKFEIYHLTKRGKQHVHACTVDAGTPEEAMSKAKQTLNTKGIFNIWAIRQSDIRFTKPEEKDLWVTLPEKKFRDASDYKGGDKLKDFLNKQKVAS